jgi:hypothetical protein
MFLTAEFEGFEVSTPNQTRSGGSMPHFLDVKGPNRTYKVICDQCGTECFKSLKNSNKAKKCDKAFCSMKCTWLSRRSFTINPCPECGVDVKVMAHETTNRFCSISCGTRYNNKHKKHGTTKSKLEVFLETTLLIRYPSLEFHFNRKDAIESELDIFIPSLKVGIELNGIFHFEPIYGKEKLDSILKNDQNKFLECQKRGISLCVIDTSHQKQFSAKSSAVFVDIICSIIDKMLAES